jgi:hypothetical protein
MRLVTLNVLMTSALIAYTGYTPGPNINSSIAPAYHGACMVLSKDMVGSGVLLNTGYILTTAHGVDNSPANGLIDPWEKEVEIKFFNPQVTIKGEVIAVGNPYHGEDVALIKPIGPHPESSISLSEETPHVGTEVFTIGAPRGNNPHITDGRICHPGNDGTGSVSTPIYPGNSGGGVFRKDRPDECVGLIIRVAVERHGFPVPIQEAERRRIVIGYHQMMTPIFHMGEYVQATSIRNFARRHKVLDLIQSSIKPPRKWKISPLDISIGVGSLTMVLGFFWRRLRRGR